MTQVRYTGLPQAGDIGLSVAATVARLRRFAYIEERLLRLYASRIVTLPQRDAKVVCGRLLYETAQHAQAWRERAHELRTNRNKLEIVPDDALEILFDEAEHLPDIYPFLAVITRWLQPSLHAAYTAYQQQMNGLADYQGMRLLRQVLDDEQIHHELLTALLATFTPTESEEAAASQWASTLEGYLTAAGGIDGMASRGEPVPRQASTTPYQIPRTVQREANPPRVWDFATPPLEEIASYRDFMMAIRLSEISVAEGIAIVLCETPDRPWSFHYELARHCWDEVRHSLFGEVAIETTYGDRNALPLREYEAVYVQEAPPLEHYAVLGLEVEGQNMKYPPGKRLEYEFARDMADFPLLATLQDFDWADEVLHVNIARRQLQEWFTGGIAELSAFAREGKQHRVTLKQRQPPTQVTPQREITS